MKNYYLTVLLFVSICLAAQNLPVEMYYSADGKILYTGGQSPTGFYDRTVIRNVYLNFTQADYWAQLTANYASETDIPATMIVDGVTYPDVGVRFRGNTSFQMTGPSQKKSFAIDTEFTTPDQEIMGYKNLKFNNAASDPTFMREVLYNRMARRYMPIAKGNYVHLYINNADWGLYPNIQSIDKSFLKEWFESNDGIRFRATPESGMNGGGWGDGTAGMNYIGADTLTYKNYYSLKASDLSYPWQKLVDVCEVLGTATAANTLALKEKLDVDKALWFLAAENIFTDDDSYVMKGKMDYEIYYEVETGRITPLEYDGNSTFGISIATSSQWGPFKNVSNVNYPLLNKLVNIPEWRQRYLAHYRTILSETFTSANSAAIIDEMNAQIAALVASDPKKLYSTAQYNAGIPGLKAFVTNRRNYLLSNPEVSQAAPVIASAPFYNSAMVETVPTAGDVANVKATVTSTSGISKVNLYYGTGLVGNFTSTPMFDDGAHNDGAAADGIYGAQVPGFAANTFVRYYVEAVANNAALSASYLPAGAEHDIFVYTVAETILANGVVINEILSSNTADAIDEAGDHEDWVELYNNNASEIDLSGYYLSDNATDLDKWQFPSGTTIPANGYLIVWADNEASEGALHASWKISVDGESVTLSDAAMNVVDQVIFSAQTVDKGYARIPNGTGDFVIQDSTIASNNEIPLATNSFDIEDTFVIFPNPASETVNIRVGRQSIGKTAILYNAMGQSVLEIKLIEQTQINTNVFAKGIYLIRIGNETRKLVIQ